MRKNIAIFLTALTLTSISFSTLADPPTKIQASYDVMGFGFTLANITETFTRTQDNYQIESVTKAVGMLARFKPETIRVTSQGKITAQGLQPLAFSLVREVDTHKNASAKFNWEKAIITHSDYKGVIDLPLVTGTQDRLSVLYHLPIVTQSNQAEYKFNISDGNNIENYAFSLSPNEREITVPLDSFKTRHVTNTPTGEEVKYDIWMATEHNYFPCKIIVTDAKGSKLTQVLTQLTITP